MVANASTAYRQAYPIAKGSALLPGILIRLETKIALDPTSLRPSPTPPVGIRCTRLEGQRGGELVAKRTLHQDYVTKCQFLQRVSLNFGGCGKMRGRRDAGKTRF